MTTPGSLLDLGSRQAVDLALHRMVRKGTLRRLGRGLYDYPQTHPQLGPLLPPLEALAKALAGQRQIRIDRGDAARKTGGAGAADFRPRGLGRPGTGRGRAARDRSR